MTETHDYAAQKYHVDLSRDELQICRYVLDENSNILCTVYGGRSKERAELIVTAVNARDGLMNAAQAAVHALKSYQYGNSSPDLAQEVIVALEAALKLARAEA